MWTKKYTPKNSGGFINNQSIIKLKKLLDLNTKGILVYGPTGSGKTESIYSLAKELNYELIEINSSDLRNKENIENTIGNSSQQLSLFNKNKLFLIDEIENLTLKDRQAVQTISKILEDTKYPIILTTNDPTNKKISALKRKVKLVEFEKPGHLEIFKLLKDICEKEKIEYDETSLKSLARRTNSDVRAAINDLQISTINNKLDISSLDSRNVEDSMLNVLKIIFKTTDPVIASESLSNSDLDLNEVMLWVDENLPYEYSPKELKTAYETLAKADIFKSRIIRQQHYRLLVYQSLMLSSGIAMSKQNKNNKVVNYKRTMRMLKYWMSKQKNLKKESIIKKIAIKTHNSSKTLKNDFDYLKMILNKEASGFNFSDDEINYLKSYG